MDLTNDPSDVVEPRHPDAPTSEVGSPPRAPYKNLEGNMNRAEDAEDFAQVPRVEASSVSMDVFYKLMLQQQDNKIDKLIQALKQPFSTGVSKTSFPEFNPDKGDVDARAWCETVALCMEEEPLVGSNLIIALSRALKGSASSWFAQISYSGMDWSNFREIFFSRYDSAETSAAALLRINSSTPTDGESISSFANRTLTSLMAKWKNLSVEEIAVSTAIARCVQIEPRMQRLAYTTDIKDRTTMQRELMAFTHRKCLNSDRVPTEQIKRMKPITCYTCGQIGHKSMECKQRNHKMKTFNTTFKKNVQRNKDELQKRSVVCFKCGQVGHIAPQCTGHRASSSQSPTTSGKSSTAEHRRVDV